MKKTLKSGFTLAEVLITLAIIGIVAAIVMPAVITSYQFKTVGVKLAKFASTVENAARAYVVSNDSFVITEKTQNGDELNIKGENEATNFVNESLIFKSILEPTNYSYLNALKNGLNGNQKKGQSTIGMRGAAVKDDNGKETNETENYIGVMKDNTKVQILSIDTIDGAANWTNDDYNQKIISTDKVGEGAFIIVFDPSVTGLPKSVQKSFTFVVTELGYMFPAANDECLWTIYNNDWTTKSDTFKGDKESNVCLKQ